MPRVFVSYRRSDTTAGYASWIYDRLGAAFGSDQVFMDIDSLPLGVDFVEHLDRALAMTDVALILIGPGWFSAVDETGARRLDDPHDLVRTEVAAVLRANVRVIPVLVDGAPMPKAAAMPEDLRGLSRRQALIFDRHGGTAIAQLITAIGPAVREREESNLPAATEVQRATRGPVDKPFDMSIPSWSPPVSTGSGGARTREHRPARRAVAQPKRTVEPLRRDKRGRAFRVTLDRETHIVEIHSAFIRNGFVRVDAKVVKRLGFREAMEAENKKLATFEFVLPGGPKVTAECQIEAAGLRSTIGPTRLTIDGEDVYNDFDRGSE